MPNRKGCLQHLFNVIIVADKSYKTLIKASLSSFLIDPYRKVICQVDGLAIHKTSKNLQ